MLINRFKNIRGDTIVEVMVSIVVLGLVLGTAYSLSNKSLKTGTQANQRSQALSVASSQIERLKAQFVELDSTTFASQYQSSTHFCILYDSQTSHDYVYQTFSSSGPCSSFEGSIYTVEDSYDSTTDGTYTILVTWQNVNGNGNDNLTLYYRLP